MRLRRDLLVVLCIGVAFAGAHRAQSQEAASADLPDQFQTGEMASTSKPKKKKTEPSSQTLATVRKQNTAPTPRTDACAGRTAPAESSERREKGRAQPA